MTFMQKKTVTVDGIDVEITQLSGLERYDYLDFATGLSRPKKPAVPDEGATAEELERYEEEFNKVLQQFSKLTFVMQSRLVAYGFRNNVDDIDQRHKEVMGSMTPEQVYFLHDEISRFSGMALPESPEDNAPEPTTDGETTEPADPKA